MGQWLLVHWKDFEEEEHAAQNKLAKFLTRYERESDVQDEANRVKQYLDTARKYGNLSSMNAPELLLPAIIPKTVPCPLRKVHPEEMARQITLMQWQVFIKLNLAHTIPLAGTEALANAGETGTFSLQIPVRDEYVPGTTAVQWAPFEEWNNLGGHLQRWTATCVCTDAKALSRAKTLQFLIEVAYYLYKLNNFDGAQRLLEGLKLLPLPHTWSLVPPKARAIHETLLNSIRLLFSDPARITHPSHPHIPIIETFTNALTIIGHALPRFNAKTPAISPRNAPKLAEARSQDRSKDILGTAAPPTSQSAPNQNPLEAATAPTSTWSEGFASGSTSNEAFNPINPARAHEEAVFLNKLRSYQTKPFPFQPVQWISDFVSRIAPLSVWTIQEYCETLEPPKYSSPTAASAMRKHTSSPRHIAANRASPSNSFVPAVKSGASSPVDSHSPPSSPKRGSPDSSPRDYQIDFSPSNNSIMSGWGTIGETSPLASPNSSPPKIFVPVSLGGSAYSVPASTSGASSLASSSSSNPMFHLRRPLNRAASPAELELERLGFFVYSAPPVAPTGNSDSPKPSSTQAQASAPQWWILLDDDRLDEADEDALAPLLLEYLPLPSWDSLFTLNPLKSALLSMRNSKLATRFKAAAKLRFRQDFCFAAPAHSKGLKLSAYRLQNNEAVQYTPTFFSVVLTNTSSAPLDWEFSPALPISSVPHITRDELFVSFSPPSGTLSPGKSITVKITAVLLQETQFYKIFRIRAAWQDLQYSNFVPLMLALSCPAASSTVSSSTNPRDTGSFMSQLTASEETKRRTTFFSRKQSSTALEVSDMPTMPSSPAISPLMLSTPSFLLTNKKEGFWKIPGEELKLLKRLGGTQAAVSLCTLYGAEVVLKKWDLGTLDPIPAEFQAELDALRSLRHPNLVQFLGAQCTRGTAFLVTEYLSRGALSDVLQSGELRRRPKISARSNSSQPSYHSVSSPSSSSSVQTTSMSFNSSSDTNPLTNTESVDSSLSTSSPRSASGMPTSVRNPNASATVARLKLGIAADVASAMAFMHYNRKLHRDLKSLNVLIDEGYRAKVCDLGSSKEWVAMLQMTSGVGSLDWIAPEVVTSRTYSFAADVFSYGLVLWELVHERFPDRPMDMVGKGGIPMIETEKLALLFRDSASPTALQFSNLITKCCDTNPENRPTFANIVIVLEQLLTNPFAPSDSIATPASSNPSLLENTNAASNTANSTSDQVKRLASGDQWIRAMKNQAGSSSSPFLHQQNNPPSSNTSPASSSPLTPPQLNNPLTSSSREASPTYRSTSNSSSSTSANLSF